MKDTGVYKDHGGGGGQDKRERTGLECSRRRGITYSKLATTIEMCSNTSLESKDLSAFNKVAMSRSNEIVKLPLSR